MMRAKQKANRLIVFKHKYYIQVVYTISKPDAVAFYIFQCVPPDGAYAAEMIENLNIKRCAMMHTCIHADNVEKRRQKKKKNNGEY